MIETISQPLDILIVDDEVNIRKTLSVCLEIEGYKVIAVSNFQDALGRRRGATDYIPKPFTPAQVKLAVDKVFEMQTLEQRVA